MAKERILVVEDERAVARGIEYALKAESYTVLLAETGHSAIEIAREQLPQLLLLDIRLPDMSGFDVCRELRRIGLHQPILIVTARDEEMDRVLGLELGADDYILKPFSLRELMARIRAALRRAYGEFAGSPETSKVSFGEVEVDLESMQVARAGQPVLLTPTEFRILRLLVSNPGQVFSRDQILDLIWGYDSDIGSDRTIDVHMRHLREKVEEDPANPRWLVTARGFGYKFQP